MPENVTHEVCYKFSLVPAKKQGDFAKNVHQVNNILPMHTAKRDAEFFERVDNRKRPAHSDDESRIIYQAKRHDQATSSPPAAV
jgi:hypothetical protein